MKKHKKLWITISSIIAFLVIANFALESVALHYTNKALSEIEGYKGSIKDIDIHLYRGAYRIDSLVINKIDNGNSQPFVAIDAMDISIEWKSIFKGAITGEFYVEHPVINFIKRGDNVDTGGDNDFIQTIKDLSPITINRFEINNGEVHYIDYATTPNIDIAATSLNALATNLTNVDNKDTPLPSNITLSANTSGNGRINSHLKMNILKETPDFDFSFKLEKMDLTYLKDFTDAYAKFTFKKGTLGVSSELVMDDGNYNGYLKPVLDDIKIIDLTPDSEREKEKGFFKKVWELIVGGTVAVVKNKSEDRLATRVPLKGDVKGGEPFTWALITNVFRNGFIKAFDNNIEGSINFTDAKAEKTSQK
ncbi:DUF748 domain-containing protein [Flavobacterium arcticum]|uniref:DUF748 domain-containing protein n=1 Tax=Flavobacterium arcticum TaxID=1784713 RepID=A0A345H8K8_9FLAO|nr:DUF748 domain-containing protein [Flavobacterium arcticum]AXG72918.1 DUF748 domain-containing protein [Flavobacterium arcticum]KAF2510417.1 DUF748 domain-containing protein [Flavobacterium arcticum]